MINTHIHLYVLNPFSFFAPFRSWLREQHVTLQATRCKDGPQLILVVQRRKWGYIPTCCDKISYRIQESVEREKSTKGVVEHNLNKVTQNLILAKNQLL